MKRIRTFAVLLISGILICVTSLSTEEKMNLKALMPWREFAAACALHMRSIQAQGQEAEREQDTGISQENIPVSGGQLSGEAEQIRVLLTHNQDGNAIFDSFTISCNTAWYWAEEKKNAGEQVAVTPESFSGEALTAKADDEAAVFSVSYPELAKEEAIYEGSFTFYPREGGFTVINTVPLETYVSYTIPGEMPASYPREALKAQAVCSRTYAICHKGGLEEQHADLDDTVSWQVYNSQGMDERAKQAAEETRGEILLSEGEPVDTYFFSTSCGLTSTDDVWNTDTVSGNLASVYLGEGNKMPKSEEEFAAYIRGKDPDAWEHERPWFRWTFTLTGDALQALAEEKQPDAGKVKSMAVTARSGGWAATELTLVCENRTWAVSTEYAIRQFLAPSAGILKDAEGEIKSLSILPSAYFTLQPVIENGILTQYVIYGGGYGHGVGMSQNGAADMASAGMDYREILHTFYVDVEFAGIE